MLNLHVLLLFHLQICWGSSHMNRRKKVNEDKLRLACQIPYRKRKTSSLFGLYFMCDKFIELGFFESTIERIFASFLLWISCGWAIRVNNGQIIQIYPNLWADMSSPSQMFIDGRKMASVAIHQLRPADEEIMYRLIKHHAVSRAARNSPALAS